MNLLSGVCVILTIKSPGAPYSISSPIFTKFNVYPSNTPAGIFTIKSSAPEIILFPSQVKHFFPMILPLPEHLVQGYVIML